MVERGRTVDDIFSAYYKGEAEMASGTRKVSQYETILKGPIDCPSCGKTMTLRNLRYKHACGTKKAPDIDLLAERAREAAIKAHRVRIGAED